MVTKLYALLEKELQQGEVKEMWFLSCDELTDPVRELVALELEQEGDDFGTVVDEAGDRRHCQVMPVPGFLVGIIDAVLFDVGPVL